jgi:NADH dehydrogenase
MKTATRICVLGGTGFVGRHLAARLAAKGFDVVVPTRSPARHRDLQVLPGLRLVPIVGLTVDALRPALDGCSAAVNLVGILNERGHSGQGFHAAHVAVTEAFVDACARTGVKRILQMSALKANAERGPSHYLRTKGLAEQVVADSSERGLEWTILRPSVIFGADDSFINRFARLLRRLPMLPLARADALLAPVHIDDITLAFARILAHEGTIGERIELCGPDVYSLREIVRMIQSAFGLRRTIVPLPTLLGQLQAFACDYCVPGKPFSLDNFRSLSVASTCSGEDLRMLGIEPHRFEPTLAAIARGGSTQSLTHYRMLAGR